jgi:hypothetical protein
MMEVSGIYPTEFDPSTQILLGTLAMAGVSEEQILFVQTMMVPELVAGQLRDSEDDDDFHENIVPVLDLIFLGLLVREFIPRDHGVLGFRDERNPTKAALRSALDTAQWAGASHEDVQRSGAEVFEMLSRVAIDRKKRAHGRDALNGELLMVMLIGMILHRHVPIEEVEVDEQ